MLFERSLRELRSLQNDLALLQDPPGQDRATAAMVHVAKAIQQTLYARTCIELPAEQVDGRELPGTSFARCQQAANGK
jgi:hypothetical protein